VVLDGAIDHAETSLLYGKGTYAAWVAQLWWKRQILTKS
jgi:hypothetical protein